MTYNNYLRYNPVLERKMTAERGPIFKEPLITEPLQAEPVVYSHPEFTFDWNNYMLRFKQDRPDIQLPQVGGKILEVITRQPNVLIPYDSYCKLAWDQPYYDPSNLKTHLTKLRRQINADPTTFSIRAIADLGYILQDHNWHDEAVSVQLIEQNSLKYYPDTREFTANGNIVPLTETEAKIVQTLAKSIGRPVRHHHLNLHGHNDRYSGNSTRVHIHRLNKKLGKHGVSIKSIKNEGYVLKVDLPEDGITAE